MMMAFATRLSAVVISLRGEAIRLDTYASGARDHDGWRKGDLEGYLNGHVRRLGKYGEEEELERVTDCDGV